MGEILTHKQQDTIPGKTANRFDVQSVQSVHKYTVQRKKEKIQI